MITNYAESKFWLDISVLVAVVCNSGYTWWSTREKVTSQRFAALEKEVAERAKRSDLDTLKDEVGRAVKRSDLETVKDQRDRQCEQHKQESREFEKGSLDRLSTAEKTIERVGGEIRNLPQQRHIDHLSTRIEQLHGDVHEVSGSLKGISRAVDLMNEFLINRGK